MNQYNPVLFECAIAADGAVTYKFGIAAALEFKQSGLTGLKKVDADTMIGKWALPAVELPMLNGLQDCIEPAGGRFHFYFVLSRK
jgi:hypothetical protein